MPKLARPLISILMFLTAVSARANGHEVVENGSVIILRAEHLCADEMSTKSTHIVAFISPKSFNWLRSHVDEAPTVQIAETSLTVKVLRGSSIRRVYGRTPEGRLVIFRESRD